MGATEMSNTASYVIMMMDEFECESFEDLYDSMSCLGECFKVDLKAQSIQRGKLRLEYSDEREEYDWIFTCKNKKIILGVKEVFKTCFKTFKQAQHFLASCSDYDSDNKL